jgi:hypothetical protein
VTMPQRTVKGPDVSGRHNLGSGWFLALNATT